MTRVSKALVTVLAVLSYAGLPAAQSKPSFAGRWALSNLADGPYSPFGSWCIAVQHDNTLSIEAHVLQLMDPDGPASVTVDSVSTRVIVIGRESRETHAPPSSDDVKSWLAYGIFTASGFPVSSVTRSGWEGDQLVVVTHTTERYVSAPGRTPHEFESDRVYRMAMSSDKDGRLVVEVLQFADPGPWDVPSRSPSPTSQTVVYTRMR